MTKEAVNCSAKCLSNIYVYISITEVLKVMKSDAFIV